jgi:hypothetical protein
MTSDQLNLDAALLPVLQCHCRAPWCVVDRSHVCAHTIAAILEGPEYLAALPERRPWPSIPAPVHILHGLDPDFTDGLESAEWLKRQWE